MEKADLRQKVSNLSGCILVLDAVDRGTTLAAYAEELQTIGIPVSSNVVVAINKTGAKQSKIGEFSIHGFLARQRGVVLMPCVQCKLGLPHTPESHESLVPIRSFDMLHMAHESGYEAEPLPEVPDGRLQYQVLPDFLKMLDQFGDWIAYKFDCLLRALNCPDDLCIIHPDESQSMAVTDKIQKLLGNKYCVVKISRELIREAQANGNSWQLVFDKHPRVPLIHDLESVSNSTGLILDIFWGSGSTCVSLEALLRDFNIVPFAYLCLVDFDPRAGNSTGSGLPKYSLYQWDNPRNLLKVGG